MGANNLTYSSAGIEALTEDSENCKLIAYWDPTGKCWTIGWGHTGPDVHEGDAITPAEADTLLLHDTMAAQLAVNTYVDVKLTQHQFDALVDFTFNVGRTAFANSTVLKVLNKGDYAGAAKHLEDWVYSGGQRLQGLLNRRLREENWFQIPDAPAENSPVLLS